MRSFEIASDPYPSPRPEMDQAAAGPFAGHDFAKPVSLETPERSGPRHWGHSGELLAAPLNTGAASSDRKCLRFITVNLRPALPARFPPLLHRRRSSGAYNTAPGSPT